jgi:hypothetical protein
MLETVCTVAFFGFLRCGEFTILQNFDPTTNLCVADVEIFYSYANLHLKASKSDPFLKGVTIQLYISNHMRKECPLYRVVSTNVKNMFQTCDEKFSV